MHGDVTTGPPQARSRDHQSEASGKESSPPPRHVRALTMAAGLTNTRRKYRSFTTEVNNKEERSRPVGNEYHQLPEQRGYVGLHRLGSQNQPTAIVTAHRGNTHRHAKLLGAMDSAPIHRLSKTVLGEDYPRLVDDFEWPLRHLPLLRPRELIGPPPSQSGSRLPCGLLPP